MLDFFFRILNCAIGGYFPKKKNPGILKKKKHRPIYEVRRTDDFLKFHFGNLQSQNVKPQISRLTFFFLVAYNGY